MTAQPGAETSNRMNLGTRLTVTFVTRQFFLLFIIATLFLFSLYFYNFYGAYRWADFWDLPLVSFKYITLPAIIVVVYGYVYLWGALFAFVPSERSFQLFFSGIVVALFLVHYDHSVLDWIVRAVFSAQFTVPNFVSVFKIALAAGILSTVIFMHYNILADDFTKRMVRRGIPTEEIANIRVHMMTVLVPILFASSVIAAALGLVGEFSALVFQNHRLFPKIEILLLGVFGVAIAFVLRSIIKELHQKGGTEEGLGGIDDDAAPVRARETPALAPEPMPGDETQ